MPLVFWVAVLPAFLSFGLIAFAVSEPEPDPSREPAKNPLNTAAMRQLGPVYWRVVAVGVVFTLARFSEAFLILRAQNIGLTAMWVPAVLVLMNVVYALSAYPAGVLSDRINRTGLLALGLVFLAAADLALALLPSLGGPRARRRAVGSAYGIDPRPALGPRRRRRAAEPARHRIRLFQPVHRPCLLAASVIAGALWDAYGPAGTFLAGLGFALVALVGLLTVGNGLAAEDK